MISKQTWDKYHVLEKDRIIVSNRDKDCVYCRVKFNNNSYKLRETLEHIDNETWKKNPPLVTDIAICCGSCNASKGTKELMKWLNSPDGKGSKINKDKLAPVIKKWIKKNC